MAQQSRPQRAVTDPEVGNESLITFSSQYHPELDTDTLTNDVTKDQQDLRLESQVNSDKISQSEMRIESLPNLVIMEQHVEPRREVEDNPVIVDTEGSPINMRHPEINADKSGNEHKFKLSAIMFTRQTFMLFF